jgi:UDP-GlcNAc:undecaprenyl-phosphate GlcNAc-1-phosphate transferase
MKGKSPFVADAEHIHHKLLKAGFSQKITVAILTSVAIVGGAIATYFTGAIKHYFAYIGVLLLIMIVLSAISVITKSNKDE